MRATPFRHFLLQFRGDPVPQSNSTNNLRLNPFLNTGAGTGGDIPLLNSVAPLGGFCS